MFSNEMRFSVEISLSAVIRVLFEELKTYVLKCFEENSAIYKTRELLFDTLR